RVGAPEQLPELLDLASHQDPEHRRDVRAGDEVAGLADGEMAEEAVLGIVERRFHERLERNGTVSGDQVPKRGREAGAGGPVRGVAHGARVTAGDGPGKRSALPSWM